MSDLVVVTTREQLASLLAELVATPAGPRMVPIRESRIPYRIALRAIAEGTLPAYRVGRSTYLDRDDEDAWIGRAEHRVRPGQIDDEPEDEIGELIALSERGRR